MIASFNPAPRNGMLYNGKLHPGFPTKPPRPAGALAPASFDDSASMMPPVSAPAPAPASFMPEDPEPTPLAALAMGRPKAGGLSGFIDRFMTPQNSLGQLGRALVMAGGTPLGTAYQVMDEQQQRAAQSALERAKTEREQTWHDEGRQDRRDELQYERTKPQFFSGNEDRVQYDPTTGTTRTVFDAPTDAQDYAATLKLEPGSPEYLKAVQDYVLRSSGPTAYAYRGSLDDQRTANRARLKGVPTYRDSHRPLPGAPRARSSGGRGPTISGVIAPIIAKVAAGQPLTPGEQQAYGMYRPGRSGGKSAPQSYKEGDVVVGARGDKLKLSGGKWVPTK